MRRSIWVCAGVFLLAALVGVAEAKEGGKPFQVTTRLRVEYDDNIYQAETNKTDSLKIIAEAELLVNFSLEKTFVSLRYRPSYVWWDEREPESSDFQNEMDLVINQTFSPRVTLSLIDTLRRGQQPEIVEEGVVVREKEDFYYNTLNATLGLQIRPATKLEVGGRYIMLRYDENSYADNEDFDLYVAGLTLRQQVVPETTVMGEIRTETVEYEGADRGADTTTAGLGLEQVFSPNLIAGAHAGFQYKQFADDDIENENTPYGEATLTFLPSPATRVSAGTGYSFYESGVFPYANQRRAQVYLSLAHDFTARLSFYVSGGFTRGEYKADESYTEEDQVVNVTDGTEEVIQVSARTTFKLGRSNWLEAGWQYQDFNTDLKYVDGDDLRVSYTRNRLDLGWKFKF